VSDLVAHLRRGLDYDAWANREVVNALEATRAAPEPARRLLAHVLGASRLWLHRLEGTRSPLAVWPELSSKECREQLDDLERAWRALLSALDPLALDREVSYVNSKKEPWTSRVVDVLQHVIAHGAYHRGQIASAFREAALTPPYTDYIHAIRSGALDRG
jgi:uncharacterized damage-inducible protein DinB